ncbi:MAG: STAS domain-containing protein [Elainellaceae cyanobacterium]
MMTTRMQVYQPLTRLLSAADTDALETWMERNLNQGARTIAIDLKNVMFMDSSGLGMLLSAQKRVQRVGGVFALCGVQEQTQMVLNLTNTEKLFTIYDSVEAFERSRAQSAEV